LHLPTSAAREALSPEATVPYDKGLYLLRTDEQTYEDAISLFREAARLDPRSPLPPAALVEAQVVKCGIIKEHNCLAEAQQALWDAESLNPDSARVRLAGGMLNQASGKYQKALEDYSRVQELEPRNIDALLQIASVYFRADMAEKAIIAYQQAIELDPGYYLPHEEMGSFRYFRGEYQEAVEQFKLAIDRAPGRAVAYSNLGATLMDLGEYSPAETSLLQSLRLRETAPALNNMGAVRAYQRRDAEAVDYYQRAIGMNPNDYIFMQNLADSYRRLGRLTKSTEAYTRARNLGLAELAENPLEAFSRGFVAYCSARLGDTQRAQSEIGQALKLSPGNKSVIRNAVLTYETLGQREQALAVLRGATPELIRELEHHPDLADLGSDSRFQQLVTKIDNGGK
jgi:eukaryotic-like serine/threonine-protein kinase